MPEKIDYSKMRGITAWQACDYCKEKRRVPGGKYRHEGEVIDCPCCDGRGVTAVVISLDQFRTLMTIGSKGVKTRPWKAKPRPVRSRKKRS
jgi:hypothetical protein